MSLKNNTKFVDACCQLRGHHAFDVIQDVLATALDHTTDQLRSTTDPILLHRTQGKALFLDDLIDTIQNAPALREQLTRAKTQGNQF